jgi:hypothetical protein
MPLFDPLTQLIPKGIQWKGVPRPEKDDYDFWNGRLLIWEFPIKDARYVIGADPGQGVGEDRSVAQVLKVGTAEYADEQVAEYACDFLGPEPFAEVVAAIGRMYAGVEDEALVIAELNSAGGGLTLQNDLRFKWGYNNLYVRKQMVAFDADYRPIFGWHTTPANKRELIARGREAFIEGNLIINSTFTLEELADSIPSDTFLGNAKAASGKHDDRWMSLYLAYIAAHEDEWLAGTNIARQRRTLTAATIARDNEHVADIYRDWQNTAVSLEDMQTSWDDVISDAAWAGVLD